MTGQVSRRVVGYAGLCGVALIAALASGRPALAAAAAPLALFVATGLVLAREPRLDVALACERERALEGEMIALTVELWASVAVDRLDLHVDLAPGLELAGTANPLGLRLAAGERRTLGLSLRARRWGAFRVGEVVVRAHDRFGLIAWDARLGSAALLRVYPRPEPLRELIAAARTQAAVGSQVSSRRGEGIEFADIRPASQVGDPARRINWRATARRGAPWIDERHPERNTDVVLFLDTFAEARRGDLGTLDLALRAITALASAHLARRDRVGVVGFGGTLRWLTPRMGIAQLYRIVDALIETEVVFSYAWKDARLLPPRILPAGALVLALTPLLDDRAIAALLDLRARGFDLAVIEVSPLGLAPAGEGTDALAHRLWRLRREVVRARYIRLGVAVAQWREDQPLHVALTEVSASRRQAHA